MKPLLLFFVAIFALLLPSPQVAAMEPAAQREVDYLITYVGNSGYVFIRSGKEYSAAEGAAHLRMKLSRAGDRVKTADDFVAGIASKSYLSGGAYRVKTPEGKTFPTGPWLTEALEKHRKAKGGK